ncbi:MAG: flagellar FlbD family protein [Phycisphaerales bacterium]
MIALTRLNGQQFVLNAELIKIVEGTPDTTIRLTNGESYIVRETPELVVDRAIEYGQLLRGIEVRH